jgi:hypothetical protein
MYHVPFSAGFFHSSFGSEKIFLQKYAPLRGAKKENIHLVWKKEKKIKVDGMG